jgi:nitrogen fixation NifU-like protein
MTDENVFDKLQNLWMGNASEQYSDKVLELAYDPMNVGELDRPDSIGFAKGSCGDRMSIFIKTTDGIISEITFLTDGCGATLACGSAVTQLAKNRTPYEAMKIHPQNLVRYLDGLPASHLHCAILAVQTLRKALENLANASKNKREK